MKHDKELVKQRFARSLAEYDSIATVQREIARRLARMIARHVKNIGTGIELGAGTGFLTRELVRLYPQAEWIVNDITEQSAEFISSLPNTKFVAADGENFSFGKGVDLIASASTVQWFDSLADFIARAADMLSEEGVLAVSTFGPENFKEITATTGNSLEYFPLGRIKEWLGGAGFEILESEEWRQSQAFDSPVEVLKHIKATGVNAIEKERWTHSRLKKFEDDYRRMFDPVTLTFHPLIIIARKI